MNCSIIPMKPLALFLFSNKKFLLRLWNVDATASDGLAQFLNYENTTTLETEIKVHQNIA